MEGIAKEHCNWWTTTKKIKKIDFKYLFRAYTYHDYGPTNIKHNPLYNKEHDPANDKPLILN